MITLIDEFLSPDDAKRLRDYLLQALAEGLSTPADTQLSEDFQGREIDYAHATDEAVLDVMDRARRQVASIAAALLGWPRLYPYYTDLVLWREGQSMASHTDNAGGNAERVASAVVYLSDDFEGGETVIDDYGPIKPVTGRLVVYPSGRPHAVNPVTRGMRHTLALWCTGSLSEVERR